MKDTLYDANKYFITESKTKAKLFQEQDSFIASPIDS